MSHHLQFLSPHLRVELIETVELGVCLNAEVVVVHIVEAIDGVSHHVLVELIPALLHATCVPTGIVGERWNDVDVFQHLKRSRHRDGVLHAVGPILDEIAFQQLVLLCPDAVFDQSCVV